MQPAKQVFVILRGVDAVTVEAPQLKRNELLVFYTEYHGPELRVAPLVLVGRLGLIRGDVTQCYPRDGRLQHFHKWLLRTTRSW
jgi:hypothetical protein